MTETLSIDLATLLLFTMPGFFFLRALGYKPERESELTYFIYSMFWGILLMFFGYNKLISNESIVPLQKDPYAGAIVFSMIAFVLGWFLQWLYHVLLRPPYEFPPKWWPW